MSGVKRTAASITEDCHKWAYAVNETNGADPFNVPVVVEKEIREARASVYSSCCASFARLFNSVLRPLRGKARWTSGKSLRGGKR